MSRYNDPNKEEIINIIKYNLHVEYVQLIEPLVKRGIKILTNYFNLSEVSAEKIVEDAVIKSMTRIDDFDDERGKFSTWVLTIIVNSTKDFLRKSDIETSSLDEMTEKGYQFTSEEETIVGEKEEKRPKLWETLEFHSALSNLSSEDKDVVKLVLDGVSSKEAGHNLNISDVTFRKRKERSLKRLKDQLLQYPLFKNLIEL